MTELPRRPPDPGSRGPHAALLDMVLADPDDDEARQIYADALLEAGDPHGEFIAIQFKLVRGQASEVDVLRLRELYRRHEAAWLGDLARVLGGRIYRGGFLERARLLPPPRGDEARTLWKNAASDPRLATIRVLEPGSTRAELYRQFVLSPTMNHLREITVLSPHMFDVICASNTAWSFSCIAFECTIDAAILDRIASAPSLPHVREIAIHSSVELVPEVTSLLARWTGRRRLDALSLILPSDARLDSNHELIADWLSSSEVLAPVARLGLWLPLSRVYAYAVGTGRGLQVEVRDDLLLADVLERLSGFDELIIRPPPREVCCNLDNPWHLAAALRQMKVPRVELPGRWTATMARGY